MRAVYFDLIKTRRPAGALGGLVAAFGFSALLGAAAWAIVTYPAASARLASRAKTVHALQAAIQSVGPARTPQSDQRFSDELAVAARVTAQLNSPWPRLLDVLEQQPPGAVALLTLETSSTHGDFSLTAEARNFDQMLAYVRFLQTRKTMSLVTLHTHQINQKDREKPVRFRVTARWSGTA